MNNTVVLFDMDGTLTESRCKLELKELKESLYRLTNSGFDIGIITGSDENYLREQMGDFLSRSSCRYRTHLLPCNGTKYFKPPKFPNEDFCLAHEVSMEKHLGSEKYRELLCELICSQLDVCHVGAPLTGHFIDARGSMINWCPIGRNAKKEHRNQFMQIDKKKKVREHFISELREMLKIKNLDNELTIKLGGDTSFDIYPTGWDKTYGLRHFPNWDVWFVGDRCKPNGNDYEIYQKCSPQSFETTGPLETLKIIDQILAKAKGVL